MYPYYLTTTKGSKIKLWSAIKTYINEKIKTGQAFRRRYLLKYVFGEYYPGNKPNQGTIDIYRCHLTTVGILERVGQGKYRKIRDIPRNLSSKSLQKLAQDKSWKTWFVSEEDKLKPYE